MYKFPHYNQHDSMDCGPTCLRMISKYYGKNYSLQYLREISFITREGVSMLGICDAAEKIGFRTLGAKLSLKQLQNNVQLPCILHWNQNHFVVCYQIKKKKKKYIYKIADPASCLMDYNEDEFCKYWYSTQFNDTKAGSVLILEPTPFFYEKEDNNENGKKKISFFIKYLLPYKKQVIQLILSIIIISLLQLIFPFLTQSLVDIGINEGNLDFITLVLIAQLIISISRISVEFIQNWILLHINTRINISLISDFLTKLMKLPLRFFDSKMIGDLMQRIGDHSRIESFLTGSSISTLFSFMNFFIFGGILAYYNYNILIIFIIGNFFYIIWVISFMKYRRKIDFHRFTQAAAEQSNLIQIITGMQDIKLNNCERQKRWEWENIQAKLFKINIKGLAVGQIQQAGSIFFNQTTNILISFFTAKNVIEGNMSLGMMISIQYIIGQLNGPVTSFIDFTQKLQDVKISADRLNEIHQRKDEESNIVSKCTTLPDVRDITINHLYFSYDGSERNYVLKDICTKIEEKKVTAIVGASGSGKTTLLKILLGFYTINHGKITIGNTDYDMINPHLWREKCGSVMQDGFIFSDTIINNIAIGEEKIDMKRLYNAVEIANIRDFIESLPLSYNTKIGMEGNGISQGQKQRILIARAIYKNPEYLFFDEATNALDSNNEQVIMNQLYNFYKGKTAVIVAHRLSTIKNADKIIVLNKGSIVEEGTHTELIKKEGLYYNLIKKQIQ